MDMSEEHSRVLNELYAIRYAIEALTPLKSNWNGILRLETIEGEKASKSFICDIVIRPDLTSKAVRWRTLIHESFHACSAGYRFHDFNANIGWEEGVVEKLERLFRQPILNHIGAEVDYTLLAALDDSHPFDRFITPLEEIRLAIDRPPEAFYLELLAIEIKDRYSHLVGIALRMPEPERRTVLQALSAARPKLEGN